MASSMNYYRYLHEETYRSYIHQQIQRGRIFVHLSSGLKWISQEPKSDVIVLQIQSSNGLQYYGIPNEPGIYQVVPREEKNSE